MQTSKERREALEEHIRLIKQLPKEGVRVTLESYSKPHTSVMTKTEQMYRR